jgi:hypothetical protein
MTESWTIEGDYAEACNCTVACQCIWLEPPNDDACTASLAWHIEQGRYGDVRLDGTNVGMLIAADEGVMFGPETEWDVVLFVDEAATDEQRAAIEDIYLGRAGGIWAPVAETHYRTTDVVSAPITFSRDGSDISVVVDDTFTMEVVGTEGFNEELGTISPHPLTKDFEMHTGKSTTATAAYDDAFTWDVSGNNSYLGDFELANG